MNSSLISVVVPMYYEEKVVNECYNRLTTVLTTISLSYEIIFVNDGSTDNTLPLLESLARSDSNVKVISFSRNFGHQVAVSAGIDYAKGDAIVIIDADLQDPPELIPDMITLWQQGYNVVYAKRKIRKGETFSKLITAKFFYRLLDKLSEVKIPLDTGDFRLIDKKVADVLRGLSEHNRFLRGIIAWAGFNQTPILYERHERFAGNTKYPFTKMLKFGLDGIISFSSKPLRLILSFGFLAIFIALILFLYTIISVLSPNMTTVKGWPSLMITLVFFSGVQLVSIGILGEYIARMYDENKNRPLYIVDKTYNID